MDPSGCDGYSDSPPQPPATPSPSRSVIRRADMPSEPAAYSVENFEPSPPQELVCTVCRGVYRDPVECPCRHVFCSTCIRDWLARGTSPGSGSCPVCRRGISVSQVVPVVPLVTDMIARLKMRCPNSEAGCTAKVVMESLNHHLDTCQFRRAHCPDCTAPMLASELFAHRRERCSKRMVRCRRDCGLSLCADAQPDHDCIREMRNYITTLERTLDVLRQQLEYTLQQLSHVNRQIRQITVRMEAFSAHVPAQPEAPATPRSCAVGSSRRSQKQRKHVPGRNCFESASGTRATGSSSTERAPRSSLPASHRHRWVLPTDPVFSTLEPQQEDLARQCAPAFQLFSDPGSTANHIHDSHGRCAQSHLEIYTPQETSRLDGAPFHTFAEPLSGPNSVVGTSGQQPAVFRFGVEHPSEPALTPNMSSATFRKSATSTRLRDLTGSETLARAGPPTISLYTSMNTTTPGGAERSTFLRDLTTELASGLRLGPTASVSGVTGGWQTLPPDSSAMQSDGLTRSLHTPPPAHENQRNAGDSGILRAQFSGGDGYFSSFMQRMRETEGHDDGGDSPHDG